MTQVIAIDWSGRKKGAAEAIWLARVVDGKIIDLENGRDRQAVIDKAIELAGRDLDTVVGLDFAFAFPAWYSKRRGWTSGRAVWEAMREHADVLIEACEPPFWGRPGTKAQQLGDPYRETEKALATRPKSVFQIGGAGAVGTGSLRGMRHLLDFSDAGFAIWPFDDPGWPLVVEIYPRLFANGVVKSRHRSRRDYLATRFPDQPEPLRERAAGSEDSFDATVSALTMSRHIGDLEALPRVESGDGRRIEGAIWTPMEAFG